VGYYDPEDKWQSYICPTLDGACGFFYPDDSITLTDADCHLRVETRHGVLRFRLSSFDRHEDTVEIGWTGQEPAENRFRQTKQDILEVVDRRLTGRPDLLDRPLVSA